MKLELTPTNLLNIGGAIAGGYIIYHLTGGTPVPVLAQFVPIAAGVVAGLALWRHLKRG